MIRYAERWSLHVPVQSPFCDRGTACSPSMYTFSSLAPSSSERSSVSKRTSFQCASVIGNTMVFDPDVLGNNEVRRFDNMSAVSFGARTGSGELGNGRYSA